MPAPKGNKFAIGNNGGRPAFYEKPEDMLNAIDEYFDYIKGEKKKDANGNDLPDWEREPEPATISGLALYIGFESRKSLQQYSGREEFTAFINKARLRVEYEYEKRLHGNNVAGLIFVLKNMGWADHINQQLTGAEGSPLLPQAISLNMPAGTEIKLPDNFDGER